MRLQQRSKRSVIRAGALAAVLALAVTASACGGSDSKATEETAGGSRKAAETCPKIDSEKTFVFFTNNSSLDVVLQVPGDSWSCTGFEGPSNPGALNGLIVKKGATVTGQLQRGTYFAESDWTLIFRTPKKTGKCCAIVALGPRGEVHLKWLYKPGVMVDYKNGWVAGLAGEEESTEWSRVGYAEEGRKLNFSFSGGEDERGAFTITDG